MKIEIGILFLFSAICIRVNGRCPRVPTIKYGSVSCNDDNNEGSACVVECEPGYKFSRESDDMMTMEIMCDNRGKWERLFPKCVEQCPPKADIVFVLDFSTSTKGNGRRQMRSMLRQLIQQWNISSESINVAAVPYHNEVIVPNVVHLNNFTDDKTGLVRALRRLGQPQEGSTTGNALNYVSEVILAKENGNRHDAPDVVIVMSDGRGQDNIDEHLSELWKSGVSTYAVGFHPREGMEIVEERLLKIAQGDAERMHMTEKHSLGNTKNVVERLRKVYCVDSVTRCVANTSIVPINGDAFCTSSNKIGSTCTFQCDEGFVLIGEISTTCVAHVNGNLWTQSIPTCFPKCHAISMENGNADCTSSSEIGSVCRFECDAGYTLVGSAEVTCIELEVGSAWDAKLPACVELGLDLEIWIRSYPQLCHPVTPAPPQNGTVYCSNDNEIGSVCTFICDEGLTNVGDPFTKCIQPGKEARWTVASPFCDERCAPIATIVLDKGDVSCSAENEVGSECTFHCNIGYNLIGKERTTCVRRSVGVQWSETTPYCKTWCNPSLPIPPSDGGVVCTERNDVGSFCTFYCDDGYTLEGPQFAECSDTSRGAAWSVASPKCVTRCESGMPVFPIHGYRLCTNSNELGSKCRFMCDFGYSLIGSKTIECVKGEVGAVWSGESPTCAATCYPSTPPMPTNGEVVCTDGNEIGSICTFICKDGYSLLGNRNTECVGRGIGAIWSLASPVCQETCRTSLLAPYKGEVSCTKSNEIGSVCRFSCEEGHFLTDDYDIECLKNEFGAEWSMKPPSCVARCNPSSPSVPRNGNIFCNNRNEVGSVCSFTCDDGYSLVGDRRVKCTETRKGAAWSSDSPSCVATCSPALPASPKNGIIRCSDANNLGSICNFICEDGYYLVGEDTTECVKQPIGASWTSETPICVARCERAIPPTNGNIVCTDRRELSSVCTFICEDGYSLFGAETTECLERPWGASWSMETPSCIARCGRTPPTAPLNGNVICSDGNEMGSVCTYRCDEGYLLIGDAIAECVEFGTIAKWSSKSPACVAICGSDLPESPINGHVTCTRGNKIGSICKFTCSNGYSMVGDNSIECSKRHRGASWSSKAPLCVARCSPRIPPVSAKGNVVCTNRNEMGSICMFTCQAGYVLVGENKAVCVERGLKAAWSSESPLCVATCKPVILRPPINGKIQCSNSNELGSICTADCDDGYDIVGNNTIECVERRIGARWTSKPPLCVARCNSTLSTSLNNGRVSCTDGNEIGSICTFACNTGYFLVGEAKTKCEEREVGAGWNNELPMCVARCYPPKPTPPSNGRVACNDGNSIGSVCTFSCNAGYFIKGTAKTECSEHISGAIWSEDSPECVAKCQLPASPKNGRVSCTNGDKIGSKCSFQCIGPYHLVGQPTVVCTERKIGADWNTVLPSCVARCKPVLPKAPGNGRVTCTDRNEVNSVCTFRCNRGFALLGSNFTTCLENFIGASWNKATPTCVATCGDKPPAAPVGGSVTCTNTNGIGSICSFSCDAQFALVGSPRMRCLEQGRGGTWDKSPPTCVRRCVPELPPSPKNGSVTCTKRNNIGSICTYRCSIDFSLVGSLKTKCVNHGVQASWDQPTPSCVGNCRRISYIFPTNGRVMCTNSNKVGSICTFQCDSKLSLSGHTRTVCVDEGGSPRWSNPSPKCVAPCFPTVPKAPKNGGVACTDRNEVGSMCTFRCNTGFHLDGNLWTTCRAGKGISNWEGATPSCVVRCNPGQGSAPANGNVTCTKGSGVGSVCTFACHTGFQVGGVKRMVCVKRGISARWNNRPPVCIARCASIPSIRPRNGVAKCSRQNAPGSVCNFRCNSEFELEGSSRTACIKGATGASWNKKPPTCVARCPRWPLPPDNGNVTCTTGKDVGSTCTFQCRAGFVIFGDETTVCVKNGVASKAHWTSDPPACIAKCYPAVGISPVDGSVACSNESYVGSICAFECAPHRFLEGNSSTECVEHEDGASWNRASPSCVAKCKSVSSIRPQNGTVYCTNLNEIGSLCSFECEKKHTLVGAPRTKCMETTLGATWSNSPPICAPKCFPRVPPSPKRGKVVCNNSNELGSTCEVTCYAKFAMKGGNTVTCSRLGTGAAWDNPSPTCVATCFPRTPRIPRNGSMSCSDGNLAGSICSFACDTGFHLVGKKKMVCTEQNGAASWGKGQSKCIEKCSESLPPSYGTVQCTNENEVGSTCSYTCNKGFTMMGNPTRTCNIRGFTALWSNKKPTCYGICKPDIPDAPENGRVFCSEENEVGSICNFQCNPGFFPVGNRTTECLANNSGIYWTQPTPHCVQEKCSPPRENIENGAVSCTDSNNVGSVCSFKCLTPGYQLYPREQGKSICRDTIGTPINEWSNPPPCCALSCPPNARMDAVIALDSSSSIGLSNWKIMTKFIENILKAFTISDIAANFAVFRYNGLVDTKSQILLKDFPKDKLGLLRAFRKFAYDGSGTLTGLAMKHIRENILTAEAGNRPGIADVVIVVTDGKSTDDVAGPAKLLRDAGAEIFVIGIVPPRGHLDLDQLRELAGDESNIQIVAGGFQELNLSFARQIASKVCGNPCER